MAEFHVIPYAPEHFDAVKTLWKKGFPDDRLWNKAEVAIPAKLAVQPDLFLVAVAANLGIGSIMAGSDWHRGWLYAVAVLNSHQRCGIGTALVRAAEDRLRSIGCSKINLQVRTLNSTVVEFYKQLGYMIEERMSMGKRVA